MKRLMIQKQICLNFLELLDGKRWNEEEKEKRNVFDVNDSNGRDLELCNCGF